MIVYSYRSAETASRDETTIEVETYGSYADEPSGVNITLIDNSGPAPTLTVGLPVSVVLELIAALAISLRTV